MPSVRNQFDAPAPTASNEVLFQMMLFYKEEMEAAQARLELRTRHFQTIGRDLIAQRNAARFAAAEAQEQLAIQTQLVANVRHGAQIITRSNDELYAITLWSGSRDAREQAQASMTRADIGFAIVQGAPFIDLTQINDGVPATPTDPDETETEDEAMQEDEPQHDIFMGIV